MPERRTIGHFVSALREKRGMTVAELATASDLDRTGVYRIEHDDRIPGFEALCALAEALNFSLDDLGRELYGKPKRRGPAPTLKDAATAGKLQVAKRHLKAAVDALDAI